MILSMELEQRAAYFGAVGHFLACTATLKCVGFCSWRRADCTGRVRGYIGNFELALLVPDLCKTMLRATGATYLTPVASSSWIEKGCVPS